MKYSFIVLQHGLTLVALIASCDGCAGCTGAVTRGAMIAHRYTYAPPRYRTAQYRRTFIPLSVSLWNDLSSNYQLIYLR